MRIKKVKHAILAARIHGLNSDPDHEIGDLQDMLRIVYKALTKRQRRQVDRRLQRYVDETCNVEGYENDYDPAGHPAERPENRHAHSE